MMKRLKKTSDEIRNRDELNRLEEDIRRLLSWEIEEVKKKIGKIESDFKSRKYGELEEDADEIMNIASSMRARGMICKSSGLVKPKNGLVVPMVPKGRNK